MNLPIGRPSRFAIAFGLACISVVAIEAYVLFANPESAFSISGEQAYDIPEFTARQRVLHAFLMDGDGLHSVSVLAGGRTTARATVKWTIWRGQPDEPAAMARIAEGIDTFETQGRHQWRTFPMTRDGSSHNRWYTIEVALIDAAPADAEVSLMASRDNPDRGGVLWVESTRQPGSLMLRANRRGRTPYQRFRREAEANLPPALQSGALLWLIALVYHWAFFSLAYALIKAGRESAGATSDRRYVAVVSITPGDASTQLFFGELERGFPNRIRIVRYRGRGFASALAGAGAVLVVRELFETDVASRFARTFRVPLYYFLDDNFFMLRGEAGPAGKFVVQYTPEAARAALREFEGVLLATPPLVAYFGQHDLHRSLSLFLPSLGPQLSAPESQRRPFTVACFGGQHLHASFQTLVFPAVRRLAAQMPVRLIAVGCPAVEPAPGLEVVSLPYFDSYRTGLDALAGYGVDVLAHPTTDVASSQFKTPHALISAARLGAIPMVSNRAPYDQLVQEDVALLCEDSADSWHARLRLACEGPFREAMRSRLDVYCSRHYAAERHELLLRRLLENRAPQRQDRPRWRGLVIRVLLAADLAHRGWKRVSRDRTIGKAGAL